MADAMYLTPQLFPARVIARVLGTPHLRQMWEVNYLLFLNWIDLTF